MHNTRARKHMRTIWLDNQQRAINKRKRKEVGSPSTCIVCLLIRVEDRGLVEPLLVCSASRAPFFSLLSLSRVSVFISSLTTHAHCLDQVPAVLAQPTNQVVLVTPQTWSPWWPWLKVAGKMTKSHRNHPHQASHWCVCWCVRGSVCSVFVWRGCKQEELVVFVRGRVWHVL